MRVVWNKQQPTFPFYRCIVLLQNNNVHAMHKHTQVGRDFHPDRSGGHVVPRWQSPDIMVRVSFLFPCRCLDNAKIYKTVLIYSFHVSIWGGLEHCLGGLAHQIPPVATGLALCETWKSIAVPRSIWLPNNCCKAFSHFGQVYFMCLICIKKLPILGKVD